MEYRALDINIKNARDLKNVNLFTTMDVYAVVSISGDPQRKSAQKTPLAKHSGSDPDWNHHPMKFSIDESAAQSNRLNLEIKFVSKRILGDRKIGKLIVPIKPLIDENTEVDEGKSERTVNFRVSGKKNGTVEFSYKFGGKYTVQAPPPPPLMAYHEGYDRSRSEFPAYAYPAPPLGYGYGPPHLAGFAYGGYGYPAIRKPCRQKKRGFGDMVLGAGAGLLGGLLIGDMISGDAFNF